MNWLERNNIKPEPCTILTNCGYCTNERWCIFKLKLKLVTEYFCTQFCIDKYCEQMKDMVL